MLPHVRVSEYLRHPFGQVRELLEADPGALLRAATAGEGSRVTVHGGVGAFDFTADVDVEIGPIDDTPVGGHASLRVPVEWRAARVASAFPVMRAELAIYPLTDTDSEVELVGSYEPPLGPLGRAIDWAVGHGVAERTAMQLVHDVAQYLCRQLDRQVAHPA